MRYAATLVNPNSEGRTQDQLFPLGTRGCVFTFLLYGQEVLTMLCIVRIILNLNNHRFQHQVYLNGEIKISVDFKEPRFRDSLRGS